MTDSRSSTRGGSQSTLLGVEYQTCTNRPCFVQFLPFFGNGAHAYFSTSQSGLVSAQKNIKSQEKKGLINATRAKQQHLVDIFFIRKLIIRMGHVN